MEKYKELEPKLYSERHIYQIVLLLDSINDKLEKMLPKEEVKAASKRTTK